MFPAYLHHQMLCLTLVRSVFYLAFNLCNEAFMKQTKFCVFCIILAPLRESMGFAHAIKADQ
jgi:hypothetical protein